MFNINCDVKQFQGIENKTIDLDDVECLSKSNKNGFFKIRFIFEDILVVWYYETEDQRDKQYEEILEMFY